MSRLLPYILILLLLSGCGGGGGSAPASSSAANDTTTLDEDTSTQVNVTANDTNISASSAEITKQPEHGTATISSGNISYTPDTDFNGTDTMSYSVDSNNNTGSNSATLTITVSSINDAPLAASDLSSTEVNTAIEIRVLDNDSDVDDDETSLMVEIVDNATNGFLAALNSGLVSYSPVLGFTGNDAFTYKLIDAMGAESNTVTVTITVVDPSKTLLLAEGMGIPTAGYTAENHTELGELIQVSAPVTFNVHTNAVSFIVSLTGSSVVLVDSLFIIDVQTPQGVTLPIRETIFCDLGLCTVQIPKRPEITTESGTWSLRLGTAATSIEDVDLSDYQLQLVSRIGPAPEVDSRISLAVKPFVTGTVSTSDIGEILSRFTAMAADSDIDVTLDPVTILTDTRFAEVSSDFRDTDTASLVLMGDPGKANIFFLEGFTDSGGTLLGISGGLPGSLGIASEYNGVLINSNATKGSGTATYLRTTAEFAFHEMNHLLGLFHTTEYDFALHDILNDTADCLEDSDLDNDGRADAEECTEGLNLMFWENDLQTPKEPLTSDQKSVLRFVPVSGPD